MGQYPASLPPVPRGVIAEIGIISSHWVMTYVDYHQRQKALSTELLHAWMLFHNPNTATGESKKKISDSVYLGAIG